METALSLFEEFFKADIRFHPLYWIPFLLLSVVLYAVHKRRVGSVSGFWAWAFPKSIYFHPSHITDLKLFILGRVLIVTKAFNVIFVQAAFAMAAMGIVAMLTGLEISDSDVTLFRVILATAIITITSDFCTYWVHRLHHEAPVIWPFHAVHHSAEVMTPVTVYRKHPLYDLVSDFVKAVLTGFVQGVILILLIGKVELSLIAGVNAFYFIFNLVGSNFRHSHIWFSYGRVLEHILISPAQHQIHHSLDPKHHNKNYGEILAVWDWLFGTLYIPEQFETLSFGISKSSKSDERVPQPHPDLKSALIVPFKDSYKTIKRRLNK